MKIPYGSATQFLQHGNVVWKVQFLPRVGTSLHRPMGPGGYIGPAGSWIEEFYTRKYEAEDRYEYLIRTSRYRELRVGRGDLETAELLKLQPLPDGGWRPEIIDRWEDLGPVKRKNKNPHFEEFTIAELDAMPTLSSGHFHDLKHDDGTYRYWLSRMSIEDGEQYAVYVEKLRDGRWVDVHQYGKPQGYDEMFGNPGAPNSDLRQLKNDKGSSDLRQLKNKLMR